MRVILPQRIVLLERYFLAFSRQPSDLTKQPIARSAKSMKTSATYSAGINRLEPTNNAAAVSAGPPGGFSPAQMSHYYPGQPGHVHAALGLAHVGTRAALSFAFAFLRRAWRNGDDLDLCTELLQVRRFSIYQTRPLACPV